MRQEESKIQSGCVCWFNLQYPEYRGLLFAVPNGGNRNLREAARLKREGVMSGVADLILFIPKCGSHGLCIEMKTEKGYQSKEQKEWQKKVEAHGYRYEVIRSFDAFYDLIKSYLE